MAVTKGDAWSLDYSSYMKQGVLRFPRFQGSCAEVSGVLKMFLTCFGGTSYVIRKSSRLWQGMWGGHMGFPSIRGTIGGPHD